jgi:hypothetical protein
MHPALLRKEDFSIPLEMTEQCNSTVLLADRKLADGRFLDSASLRSK